MPTFTVLMQQYVEETAAVEVEADSIEEARSAALAKLSTDEALRIKWRPGDDITGREVYAVQQAGDIVWER